jgi:acetyl-CoA C-acetyltransferase
MGQVLTAGAGQNPARQAAIKAGLPFAVPATDPEQGLRLGPESPAPGRAGDPLRRRRGDHCRRPGKHEPVQLRDARCARTGLRMGNAQIVDTMISDGLWDAFNDYHMGITAENLVEKYSLTREQQDAFAAASQQKAAAAIEGRAVCR